MQNKKSEIYFGCASCGYQEPNRHINVVSDIRFAGFYNNYALVLADVGDTPKRKKPTEKRLRLPH